MDNHLEWMKEAIHQGFKGINHNEGGPFGAVIVKNNQIVGRGNNLVTSTQDPTAHAEITAIRDACQNLQTFDLSDCVIYTSCEPCPMCLGAIYWARIRKIYYACHRKDAAETGFDDDFIYQEFEVSIEQRKIPLEQIARTEALKLFEAWLKKEDKIDY